METRFKNRDIVIETIKLSWGSYYVPAAIKEYESGMFTIEEMIKNDFDTLADFVLKRFSQRYHRYLSLYNEKKRMERNYEKVY